MYKLHKARRDAIRKKSIAQQVGIKGSDTEDIHTNMFLSHKRSTGQGLAGRIYESLKVHQDMESYSSGSLRYLSGQ